MFVTGPFRLLRNPKLNRSARDAEICALSSRAQRSGVGDPAELALGYLTGIFNLVLLHFTPLGMT